MLSPQIPVAKEGYPFIGLGVFATVFFALISWDPVAWLCFLATIFTLSFFRDPERFIPPEKNLIVSPADGKILLVKQIEENPFTEGPATKVSIFMNVFNVHVNRLPASGTVDKVLYRPGKFYSADTEKSALHNEYCGTVLTLESGHKIGCVQVAGLIARRIVCWLEPGDTVSKGKRYGLIRFGSRVDLYLPPEFEIQVEPHRKVRAGETVIAKAPGTEL